MEVAIVPSTSHKKEVGVFKVIGPPFIGNCGWEAPIWGDNVFVALGDAGVAPHLGEGKNHWSTRYVTFPVEFKHWKEVIEGLSVKYSYKENDYLSVNYSYNDYKDL